MNWWSLKPPLLTFMCLPMLPPLMSVNEVLIPVCVKSGITTTVSSLSLHPPEISSLPLCFFLPGGPEDFLEVETPSFDDREVPAFVRMSRYGSGCVVVGVQGLDRAGGIEADKLERRFL